MIYLAVLSLTLALSLPALAATGNEWRDLAPAMRITYVAGVADGWGNVVTLAETLNEPSGGVARVLFQSIITVSVSSSIGE